MKRALAERAKQSVRRKPLLEDPTSSNEQEELRASTPTSNSGQQQAGGADEDHADQQQQQISSPQSSPSALPRPMKIPRVASSSSGVGVGAGATTASGATGASPSPSQRQRPGSDVQGRSLINSVSAPPLTSSTSASSVPPNAAPAAEMSAPPSANTPQPPPQTVSSSPRAGQKRQRSYATSGDTTDPTDVKTTINVGGLDVSLRDVPDDANTFYMKHQNRALVVEWQSLDHQVKQLSSERDERRQDCWATTQALQSLQATWTQLETVVLSSATGAGGAGTSSPPTVEALGCPSTGTGESVEWTRALSDALEALAAANNSNHSSAARQPTAADDRSSTNEAGAEGGGTERAPGLGRSSGPLRADWSSQCAANLASRAAVLQQHLLPELISAAAASSSSTSSSSQQHEQLLQEKATLQQKLEESKGQCRLVERQVAELVQSRDSAIQSERRIRRNVLRLSAGMMTTDQLIEVMQKNINEDEEEFQLMLRQKLEQLVKKEVEKLPANVGSKTGKGDDKDGSSGGQIKREESGEGGAGGDENDALSSMEVQALQTKVAELETSVSNRDESIEKLDNQLTEKQKQITDLSLRQRSDDDNRKLEGYATVSKQLEIAQERISTLEKDIDTAKGRWAHARSNEETVAGALEEQHSKYQKRWLEIGEALSTAGTGDAAAEQAEVADAEKAAAEDSNKNAEEAAAGQTGGGDDGDEAVKLLLSSPILEQSKQITELQHKLSQAMENVRQAELSRKGLREALTMNESLQSKLEEVKTKYAALRNTVSTNNANSITGGGGDKASKTQSLSDAATTNATATRSNSSSNLQNATASSSSSTRDSSTASSDKIDKLHREHRRMRKEISAVVASKEAAKAKLERAEKERDSLVENNARLLKQITEKDDMNAKSLSTILHLKSLTEQLTLERDNLEQQVKSASQLSLAARLATNAKERFSEEVVKEKEELEKQLADIESNFATTKSQLEKITLEWSEASAKTTTLNDELSNSLKRIDELVAELEKKNAEVRKLVDAVSTAEREAKEAKERVQTLSRRASGSGGAGDSSAVVDAGTGFTVDQLNTQISVLKNRLACPVCHYRDKECIIMRCRHMHCKQCVEERITNRSRKCPTCNNRFSEKDVEDIWLN